MDVYNSFPDGLTYHSLRHGGYDYSWTEQRNDKGKVTNGTNRKDPCYGTKMGKDSCPICQEKQRRPLSTYIRSKSLQDHKNDACIEEEADGSEEKSQKASNIQQHDVRPVDSKKTVIH